MSQFYFENREGSGRFISSAHFQLNENDLANEILFIFVIEKGICQQMQN